MNKKKIMDHVAMAALLVGAAVALVVDSELRDSGHKYAANAVGGISLWLSASYGYMIGKRVEAIRSRYVNRVVRVLGKRDAT